MRKPLLLSLLVLAATPSWARQAPAEGAGLPPALGHDGSLYLGMTNGVVVQIR